MYTGNDRKQDKNQKDIDIFNVSASERQKNIRNKSKECTHVINKYARTC